MKEELNFLIDWLNQSDKQTLIIASTHKLLEIISDELSKKNMNYSYSYNFDSNSKIILSTIHSFKGLEADRVFIFESNLIEKLYPYQTKRLYSYD
ncbi:MAG: hypothetical protein N2Z20_04040 [Elusimicrobiales bacterium]|nr:hypothetical protein [Elusimicrobiales bacterium]